MAAGLLTLLLGLMCLTAPSCCQAAFNYPPMNTTTVLQLQQYIERTINSTGVQNKDGTIKLPMIPAFVRLAFHDCNSPAGCDGCVNLDIAENNGLAPAVNNLEQLYTNSSLHINTTLSRADFWALAGLTAAYYGARLQKTRQGAAVYVPPSLVPTNVFRTGRTDCASAPKGNESSSNFPDGLKGQTETFAFFKNFYNFTVNETVAILGAHTLGKAVIKDSGFQGPWVPGDNILNNAYYTTLSNQTAGWAQAQVSGIGGKIQWQRTVPGPAPQNIVIMLNADMCLYKNLTLNATGGSNCKYSSCPVNTASYQAVSAYAANNTKWLTDFGVVFNKMLNTCGHPANGVVTPCTLRALSTTVSSTAAVEVTTTQSEEVLAGVDTVLEAAEATTGTAIAPVAGVVPTGSKVNAVAGVTNPLESQEPVVAGEGVLVMMQQAAQVSAGVANPSASQEPVMQGASVPVVMQQATQALDVVDGGNQKRRAARKLV